MGDEPVGSRTNIVVPECHDTWGHRAQREVQIVRDLQPVGRGIRDSAPIKSHKLKRMKRRIRLRRKYWRARRAGASPGDREAQNRGPIPLLPRAVHRLDLPEVGARHETADRVLRRRAARRVHPDHGRQARRGAELPVVADDPGTGWIGDGRPRDGGRHQDTRAVDGLERRRCGW